MFKYVTNAVLEIGNAVFVRIPELDIVGTSWLSVAVHGRQLVFRYVGIASPAAELVTVMDGNGELDASGLSFDHELIYGLELSVVPYADSVWLNIRH